MPLTPVLLFALALAAALAAPAGAAAATREYRLVSARADLALTATRVADAFAGAAEIRVRSRRGFTGVLRPGRTSRIRARPIAFSSLTRGTKTEADGSVRTCQGPVAGRLDALRLTARPDGRRLRVAWGLGAPLEICPHDPAFGFPLLLFPPAGYNVVTYRRSLLRGRDVTLPIDLRTSWTNPSNGLSVTLAWTGAVKLRKVIAAADRGEPAPRRPRGS